MSWFWGFFWDLSNLDFFIWTSNKNVKDFIVWKLFFMNPWILLFGKQLETSSMHYCMNSLLNAAFWKNDVIVLLLTSAITSTIMNNRINACVCVAQLLQNHLFYFEHQRKQQRKNIFIFIPKHLKTKAFRITSLNGNNNKGNFVEKKTQ